MTLDWMVVATIAAPIVALFVGAWLNRQLERRPILISYFGHVAAFTHHPASGPVINVHTHTVVLSNAGRRSATNIRLHHLILPDFNIWPQVQHSVEQLPDGSVDILIPTLVPAEEIRVSYLYFPPLTYSQVNAGIKCDEGFAQEIPVLLQRQYPKWFNLIAAALMLIGLIVTSYFVYESIRLALR